MQQDIGIISYYNIKSTGRLLRTVYEFQNYFVSVSSCNALRADKSTMCIIIDTGRSSCLNSLIKTTPLFLTLAGVRQVSIRGPLECIRKYCLYTFGLSFHCYCVWPVEINKCYTQWRRYLRFSRSKQCKHNKLATSYYSRYYETSVKSIFWNLF